MTTIKANCPACGEISLEPADVTLCTIADAEVESFYAFDCPGCALNVRKRADDRVVRLLRSAGVAWGGHTRPVGPPLTPDDLLDFHGLLQTDDWFDRLRELV